MSNQSPDTNNVLEVGLASVDITPEIGVPLAGFGGAKRRIIPVDLFRHYPYATYLKPSTGILDPIRAKAMILRRGEKKHLFLSLDIVAVTARIVQDILKKIENLNFTADEVFISSTHTHCGPGTLSRNRIWQLLATDRFQEKIYLRFLDGIKTAVEGAHSALIRAQLFAGSFRAQGWQRNRSGRKGQFDPEVNLLLAKSINNFWLGGLINLGIHATALGMDNLKFSADIPGQMENALSDILQAENENSGISNIVTLFLNGAEGDVSPNSGGVAGMNKIRKEFADQAKYALDNLRPISPVWEVSSTEVQLGKASLRLKNFVNQSEWRWLVPKWLQIPLSGSLPQTTTIWNLRLDDLIFLTWPGEPTAALGLELKHLAHQAGFRQPWILGLTNDYLAYFTTPSEYQQLGYEAYNSLYGSEGGNRIVEAYQSLLKE
jgi:hypothetical protein